MSYNLDKRTSRIARQTAQKTFNVCVTIVGLAYGAIASSRKSKPSGKRRRRRW